MGLTQNVVQDAFSRAPGEPAAFENANMRKPGSKEAT
ncbi:MAG: hypothetical protein HFACDABA_01301 [Anaerolineales bacterium]|nr:hypothetical protein [Anaerolineales bacterium]